MEILALGDTHGRLFKAKDMYDKISRTVKIDMILHTGDYEEDALELEEQLSVPVISVKGNCDGCRTRDFKVIDLPSGKLLLTHGHMEHVDRDHTGLAYLAEEQGCQAILFGHTHIPMAGFVEGFSIFNPGSLTYPRDGSSGSVLLLHAEEEGISGEILYYSDYLTKEEQHASTGAQKKKFRGGFLRSIMNYSDRL